MNFRKAVPLGTAGVFVAAAALAQPASFPPRVANTSTALNQAAQCAAIDDPANSGVSANSIVLWEEIRNAGVPGTYQLDLEANQLDPTGANITGEFDVDSPIPNANSQYESDVAGDGKGKYVVVWTHESGGLNSEVQAKLFVGSNSGSIFQVNTTTTGYQGYASVARNATGDFVVVWQSQPFQGDVTIFAQRFDTSGGKVGPEFKVNDTTGNPGGFAFNERADVAINDTGDVLVVWKSPGSPGNFPGPAVVGRWFPYSGRLDPNGGTATGETLIKPAAAGRQDEPHVAVNRNGDYLVVWQETVLPGGGIQVFGRRVNPAGVPQGTDFTINTPATATGAPRPDVAAAGDEFVVVWFYGGAGGQIFARRIGPNFAVAGLEFEVTDFLGLYPNNPNVPSPGCPWPGLWCPNHPRVAANSRGNVIVTWAETDDATPGGPFNSISQGVWARRLELAAAGGLTADPAAAVSVHRPQVANNGVIEPGETVAIEPTWKNTLEGTLTLIGTGSNLKGPAGGTYTFDDTAADYGSVDEQESAGCRTATGNCYQVTISGTPRPATHWDASFLETLSNGLSKTWTLHLGESFTDVPPSQLFYRAIESVLHAGITTGCTGTTYCPGDKVSRSQMSLFLARGVAGGSAGIPNSGTIGASPYSCGAGGTSLFTDVLPTDIFCRSVHYLATQNVTSGCTATEYCPTPNVTRLEMSAFVARAVVAPGGGAAVPLTYGPDPVTNRSYSCDQASPNTFFTDVPASNTFCKHAHFLWAKNIIAGCGATTYCPNDPVTRDAMAKFLANGFQVQLYGP
jgi:hypothetical protein